MKKTLIFEGAGWAEADTSQATDVGNCRIRTAFTNDDNRKIYLEMGACAIYEGKKIIRYGIIIDHIFYITGDHDDCNISQIPYDWQGAKNNYNYSIEDITKWINKNLNCSFDLIKVLPDLAGYRVHSDDRGYNLADDFTYNRELTAKREEIKEYFYNLEKSEGKKYPNFSLWVDENNHHELHLLRHFNEYNKHWSIFTNTDNWLNTVIETKLGRYGC